MSTHPAPISDTLDGLCNLQKKRDIVASNTGTSFAVQTLAQCGEITTRQVTAEQFAAAHEAADKAVPEGVYVPNPADQPTK